MDFGPQSVRDLDTLYLRWFDHWLKGVDNGVDREKPVEAFLMGRNEWRQFTAWPPREATETRWYFHSAGHANADKSDGKLSLSKPSAGEKPDHFTYDPAHPYIPGDEETAVKADANAKNVKNIQTAKTNAKTSQKDSTTGKAKPTTGESDAHILTYTTDALEKEVIVAGPIEVHLAASTSARDTDWFAMLQDIGTGRQGAELMPGHHSRPLPQWLRQGRAAHSRRNRGLHPRPVGLGQRVPKRTQNPGDYQFFLLPAL